MHRNAASGPRGMHSDKQLGGRGQAKCDLESQLKNVDLIFKRMNGLSRRVIVTFYIYS